MLADDQPDRLSRQDVFGCTRCGACYTGTSATQQDYDSLYANRSRYASGPAAHNESDERDVSRFNEIADQIVGICPDRDCRIVDVGCANGQLLAILQQRGYRRLVGVDPSSDCVETVSRIPGVQGLQGTIATMTAESGPIDVLVLSHVLEHVREAADALAAVRQAMGANAWLYAEVPDASRYSEYLRAPFQDFNSEHINHFSATSLENLLERSGFRPSRTAQKEILSAPGMPYPALYCVAQTADTVSSDLQVDGRLIPELRRYVDLSEALMRKIDAHLSQSLSAADEVIVWGTGELTAKLLARTVLSRMRIAAFADKNPINQGRSIMQIPVVAPNDLASSDRPIIVCSVLHQDSIVKDIATAGFQNPIVTLLPAGA